MPRKTLKRDVFREALARLEEAARTMDEFEKILEEWDKLDTNRGRKERYWEKLRETKLLNWEVDSREVVIPQPIARATWWTQLRGDFIDTIHDCPHEIHEFTASTPIYDLTVDLDESQKEILYYRAIRYWSPQQIAAKRKQTDRNIRKVYTNMIEGIRYELFYYLYWRYKKRLPITTNEKSHVLKGIKLYGAAEEKEVDWQFNEEDIDSGDKPE